MSLLILFRGIWYMSDRIRGNHHLSVGKVIICFNVKINNALLLLRLVLTQLWENHYCFNIKFNNVFLRSRLKAIHCINVLMVGR